MPRSKEDEEKRNTKASVYITPEEYKTYQHDHIDRKENFRHLTDYLLALMRLGKAVLGEYDWQDAVTIFRGGDPDRDWTKSEIQALKEKAGSLEEYRKMLLERRESNKEGQRMLEIQSEILDEELEEVEHLLEK